MVTRKARSGIRVVAGLFVVGLIVGALLWQDRRSVEHGNRLYRAGAVPGAAQVYAALAERPKAAAATSYNLGTALLGIDPVAAGQHLRLAVRGDPSVAQRGYYNLGYLFLTSVDPQVEPKTAIPLLVAAVGSNRSALRLAPTDQNARWNLALAQRMLDSLSQKVAASADNTKSSEEKQQEVKSKSQVTAEALGSSGEAEGGKDREADNPQPGGGGGQRQSIVGGESEARAGNDPGPLTLVAARRLIKTISDPPEQLIRGLLWSHRPNVAWWKSEPFPGGNW